MHDPGPWLSLIDRLAFLHGAASLVNDHLVHLPDHPGLRTRLNQAALAVCDDALELVVSTELLSLCAGLSHLGRELAGLPAHHGAVLDQMELLAGRALDLARAIEPPVPPETHQPGGAAGTGTAHPRSTCDLPTPAS